MVSLCQPGKYYQFLLAQGFGMGLGMGLMAIPSVSMIGHHFHKRRGMANGLVFSGTLSSYRPLVRLIYDTWLGTSLGGILWPIALNRLITGNIGFASGMRYNLVRARRFCRSILRRIAAFICLGLLVPANVLMRARYKELSSRDKQPQNVVKTVLLDWTYWASMIG